MSYMMMCLVVVVVGSAVMSNYGRDKDVDYGHEELGEEEFTKKTKIKDGVWIMMETYTKRGVGMKQRKPKELGRQLGT